jgi:hypothetical protein
LRIVCAMMPSSPKHKLASPLWGWFYVALAGIAGPAFAMLLLVDRPAPAPLALEGGPILAAGLMGAAVFAAALTARFWIGFLLALLVGLGLIQFARALGMPPLPHPFSTGLAVIIASACFAALGAMIGRFASTRGMSGKGRSIALWAVVGQAAVLFLALALPGTLPEWLLALVPVQWASGAIQTALTGTGTRAASSALFALGGVASGTLLAARLWPRRWPLLLLSAAWLGLSALAWLRPGPPMPRADLVLAAAPGGQVAPAATTRPDPATQSAIARVQRQIEEWPAAAEPDSAQRARNLLLIAAVPDLYDTETLQSYLPALVEAELRARLPADQRSAILAAIAADPAAGSVAARETLPQLGLPANVGDEAPARNRMGLYAARLNGQAAARGPAAGNAATP